MTFFPSEQAYLERGTGSVRNKRSDACVTRQSRFVGPTVRD